MAAERELSLKEVIDALKAEDCRCSLSWRKVKLYDVEAREFLSFAREDLGEDSEKGRINALSNAKRAIECRIDELLTLFNFRSFSSRYGWKLPYKMQVLQTFDVPAPNILRRLITSKRNLLEHEYVRPNQQEVQDIVEIAELFLKATDAHIERGYVVSARISADVVWQEDAPEIRWGIVDRCELAFDFKKGAVRLTQNVFYFYPEAKEPREQSSEPRERVNTLAIKLSDEALKPGSGRFESTKRLNRLAIRDCEMEEVRELMILLRERAKK